MELEKTNYMNTLFEFYSTLLTTKQKGYLSLYYGEDYSLGEIADEFEISRQAVYDNIKRTEKILVDYEAKLHLAEDFLLRSEALDQLKEYTSKHYPADTHLQDLIRRIEAHDQ